MLCMLILLCSCTPAANDWQTQYDLGMRYLEEGNYEEAIMAFSAAIDIDPKRPEAYIGAADAYEKSDDLENALKILQQGIEIRMIRN